MREYKERCDACGRWVVSGNLVCEMLDENEPTGRSVCGECDLKRNNEQLRQRIAELEAAVSLAKKALDALGDSNGELQDRITVLEAELQQRGAEPETVDVSELREIAQTWQPIPDGETIGLDVGDTTLTVDCAYLWTRDDKQSVALPDNVRLCRLTESPPTWQPITDRIQLAHESADHKLSLYADTVFYGDAEFPLPEGYAVCRKVRVKP